MARDGMIAQAPVRGLAFDATAETPPAARLSTRILLLTVIFVMLAEIMIFVPSVTDMRLSWLRDRLNTAAAAAIVIDGLPNIKLPRSLEDSTLMATGTKAIALHKEELTRMIVVSEVPPAVNAQYDLSAGSFLTNAYDAFATLAWGGEQVVSVRGPIGASGMEIELVMSDRALRQAMLVYCREILFFSIVISLTTAALIFFTINRILIRPIGRMTASMQGFAADPGNPGAIMAPPEGRDELSVAARHLAAMQTELQRTLKQQKNLADLGLAVSKINHDMRNILSSAQLMSDRLTELGDPVGRGLSAKLVRTLGRAISYSSDVLAYGRASEAAPQIGRFALGPLVDDVGEILGLAMEGPIRFMSDIDPSLEIEADPEQMFRVIYNLCRNSLQALESHEADDKCIRIGVAVVDNRLRLDIDDNGPGMPAKARDHLFSAFRGSTRAGGVGLGLVIARDIAIAHGGTIALVEKNAPGCLFRVEIPHRAGL
ncbi:signal transduction histidine kinase [Rhizobium sp. SG_E_25_P2]|uniref:sensor histidine kinase n=1 Tax=Rhizobium sp. SG_E_25_P2 TaxID=2879942 RepID=UPI0024731B00|nr:HAMP domain-containing sensor histidine kinase [Rhizobium sp. SG_E_25_P2]MDH6264978.1 signal transduction histidine kinase [Rhizobium sp. SG_E_25_P2]